MNGYNQAISLIIPLIVKNNAGKTAITLRKAGYKISNYIPAPEMESALFQIHTANSELFYDVIKNIPWNYGDQVTNTPEIRGRLIELTKEQIPVDPARRDSDWWQQLILLLQNQSQPSTQRVTGETKNYGAIALVLIVIIVAIIMIFNI